MGAVPQLDSPEEVGLVNYDPEGMDDGVWYLAHLKTEYASHTARSSEDRRLFATRRYKIETVIAKNGHLFSAATITFEPLVAGERVLKFGLLPNLRVTRVTDDQGRESSLRPGEPQRRRFVLRCSSPSPATRQRDRPSTSTTPAIKSCEQAGEGSFYVLARTSWYPNLNGFGERSLYDLTFKVPKKFKVVSVGKLQTNRSSRIWPSATGSRRSRLRWRDSTTATTPESICPTK